MLEPSLKAWLHALDNECSALSARLHAVTAAGEAGDIRKGIVLREQERRCRLDSCP
jgi:hypothetical protein